MAKRVVTELIDDLDGSLLGEQGTTISFGLDRQQYEIDLSNSNAESFRQMLAPYIEVSRQVRLGGNSASRSRGSGRDLTAIRAWAAENGRQVNSRGRIPASIIADYDAAH